MSTVTQADRDAALRVRQIQLGHSVKLPNDGHYLIQAFAAHRTSSQVELLEALDHIARQWPDSFAARTARAAISNARSNSMVSGRDS